MRTLLLCDRLEIRFAFGKAEQAKRDVLGKRVVRRVIPQSEVDKAARTATRAVGGTN
jgi:hypothetical protein